MPKKIGNIKVCIYSIGQWDCKSIDVKMIDQSLELGIPEIVDIRSINSDFSTTKTINANSDMMIQFAYNTDNIIDINECSKHTVTVQKPQIKSKK